MQILNLFCTRFSPISVYAEGRAYSLASWQVRSDISTIKTMSLLRPGLLQLLSVLSSLSQEQN
jgi:hypothetical protein